MKIDSDGFKFTGVFAGCTLFFGVWYCINHSDKKSSLSPGVGATLWAESTKTILGSTVIGEKSMSSEELGQSVALNLLKEIHSGATLDLYAFDQILPFMILAKKSGRSICKISKLSSHASTTMWLAKKFFDIDFKIIQSDDNISIEVF